jgi:hypothetical protein
MTRITSASPTKRGRPLGEKARAIREAIFELAYEHDVVTVRQCFYRLVSAGVVPKDEASGYRPVQLELVRMRREGLIPWRFIADTTRWMRKARSWDELDDALDEVARTYRRNLWRAQGVRVEVWLEKDALAGVVLKATNHWDVPLMVSRGISSVTFLHAAAKEAEQAWEEAGVETVVLALFDFDPGGDRGASSIVRGFAEYAPEVPVEFRLLAVTEEQIDEWQLPTRPAKKTDPQAKSWGARAVELDAIPPDRLVQLVDEAIVGYVDRDAWRMEQQVEQSEREILSDLLETRRR